MPCGVWLLGHWSQKKRVDGLSLFCSTIFPFIYSFCAFMFSLSHETYAIVPRFFVLVISIALHWFWFIFYEFIICDRRQIGRKNDQTLLRFPLAILFVFIGLEKVFALLLFSFVNFSNDRFWFRMLPIFSSHLFNFKFNYFIANERKTSGNYHRICHGQQLKENLPRILTPAGNILEK